MKIYSFGDMIRPGRYLLHSAFAGAVNYTADNRLVSVVSSEKGRGPLNIVAEDFDFSNPHPELRVGWLDVSCSGKKFTAEPGAAYTSRPDIPESGETEKNLPALKKALAFAPEKSLAFLVEPGRKKDFSGGFEKAFVRRMKKGARLFSSGRAEEGAAAIRGLGFGFTPSGDDFICGFLAGLWLREKMFAEKTGRLRRAVHAGARGQNPVSNAFLECTAEGRFNENLGGLVSALGRSRAETAKAATRLFSAGETSGADTAVGFFFAMDRVKKRRI
ncbi:MAG: DUF2877 domain-containing protein [bacterium]